MMHAGGNASGRDKVESNAGADRDTGDAVQGRNANTECPTNRTNHSAAGQVWEDRRKERILLVSKPQSTRETKAEAQQSWS